MCKIEKVVFLCKIEGKFVSTNVDALIVGFLSAYGEWVVIKDVVLCGC